MNCMLLENGKDKHPLLDCPASMTKSPLPRNTAMHRTLRKAEGIKEITRHINRRMHRHTPPPLHQR